MNGSSVPDWSKAKAPSPSESSSVPAPPLSSASPLSINPDTAKSKPTPKSEAPATGAGVSYLDSMNTSTASPDWSNWKAPPTGTSITADHAQSSSSASTAEPSVPAASNGPSSIPGPSVPDTATSTGTDYLDSMSASTSPPDWSTAKAPAPPKNPPPVSPLPTSTIQADSVSSSYADSLSGGTATPDWSRATATTTTPAPTPSVPPAPMTPRQKPPTGRPEYTEPIEIRLPNMGDTKGMYMAYPHKDRFANTCRLFLTALIFYRLPLGLCRSQDCQVVQEGRRLCRIQGFALRYRNRGETILLGSCL